MKFYFSWLTRAEYERALADADQLPSTKGYARMGPNDTTDHGDYGRDAPAATTPVDPEYHNDDTTMGPQEEYDNGSGVWSTND